MTTQLIVNSNVPATASELYKQFDLLDRVSRRIAKETHPLFKDARLGMIRFQMEMIEHAIRGESPKINIVVLRPEDLVLN